mmetsp:Transcript_10612/g.20488  ORF Transcript_10612/g.20488 Transcript_10612/m.20488 type:complete len:203 (+) Transcript_10612:1130-1738(+)
MVGGIVPGMIHWRSGLRWKALMNLSAYGTKDPSTLTEAQKMQRLYRASLRRLFMFNLMRLTSSQFLHKNYFEHIEKTRVQFEVGANLKGIERENFVKEREEWLELTYFPAIAQWPNRLFANKYSVNVPYPDASYDFDPAGYYKPRPLLGLVGRPGPYQQEFPMNPDFFAFKDVAGELNDPYLKEHLEKVQDPESRVKAENKL